MPELRDRREAGTGLGAEPTGARPVVLATLAVPVHPSAERMAIESAIEAGVPLLLVNLVPLPLYVRTLVLVGPEGTTFPHEEALDEVRETAQRASKLGVTHRATARADSPSGDGAARNRARARRGLGGIRPGPERHLARCASAARHAVSGARPTAWSGSPPTAD